MNFRIDIESERRIITNERKKLLIRVGFVVTEGVMILRSWERGGIRVEFMCYFSQIWLFGQGLLIY